MRSTVTVGPPVDLLAYGVDELEITRLRRFPAGDPDLMKIGMRWEQALRQAVARLPQIRFRASRRSLELPHLPLRPPPPSPGPPAAPPERPHGVGGAEPGGVRRRGAPAAGPAPIVLS